MIVHGRNPFLGVNHIKFLGVIFLVDIPLIILLSFSCLKVEHE